MIFLKTFHVSTIYDFIGAVIRDRISFDSSMYDLSSGLPKKHLFKKVNS